MIHHQPRVMILIVVTCFAFCVVGCESRAIDETTSALRNENLMALIGMFGHNNKIPSSNEVLAAYREYVDLHTLQTELAEDFSQAEGEAKTAAEKRYVQVKGLLERPELQIIAQNLFIVLQDESSPEENYHLSDKLEVKLDKAIKSLF